MFKTTKYDKSLKLWLLLAIIAWVVVFVGIFGTFVYMLFFRKNNENPLGDGCSGQSGGAGEREKDPLLMKEVVAIVEVKKNERKERDLRVRNSKTELQKDDGLEKANQMNESKVDHLRRPMVASWDTESEADEEDGDERPLMGELIDSNREKNDPLPPPPQMKLSDTDVYKKVFPPDPIIKHRVDSGMLSEIPLSERVEPLVRKSRSGLLEEEEDAKENKHEVFLKRKEKEYEEHCFNNKLRQSANTCTRQQLGNSDSPREKSPTVVEVTKRRSEINALREEESSDLYDPSKSEIFRTNVSPIPLYKLTKNNLVEEGSLFDKKAAVVKTSRKNSATTQDAIELNKINDRESSSPSFKKTDFWDKINDEKQEITPILKELTRPKLFERNYFTNEKIVEGQDLLIQNSLNISACTTTYAWETYDNAKTRKPLIERSLSIKYPSDFNRGKGEQGDQASPKEKFYPDSLVNSIGSADVSKSTKMSISIPPTPGSRSSTPKAIGKIPKKEKGLLDCFSEEANKEKIWNGNVRKRRLSGSISTLTFKSKSRKNAFNKVVWKGRSEEIRRSNRESYEDGRREGKTRQADANDEGLIAVEKIRIGKTIKVYEATGCHRPRELDAAFLYKKRSKEGFPRAGKRKNSPARSCSVSESVHGTTRGICPKCRGPWTASCNECSRPLHASCLECRKPLVGTCSKADWESSHPPP